MTGLILVALGGACGSVLRFLMGSAGSALLGGGFPWATIAINVLGSALIGFLAAAATPDGALPDSASLRLLAMVGFCGGFTTFSSFSLQTLDLLREQRPLAAAANASLSVGLCLAAVAAGNAAGTALDLRALSHHAARATHSGTVLLAVLEDPARAGDVLDASRLLLAALGGPGRIEAIAFRASGTAARESGGAEATERAAATPEASRAEDARIEELRRARDAWAGAAGPDRAPALRVPRGRAPVELAAAARRADFLVVARPDGNDREADALHAALFRAARPVLVVPPGRPRGLGRSVAVDRAGDRRMRAAVRAAAPLLARAERVTLFGGGEEGPARAVLPPGVRDRAIAVPPPGEDGTAAHGIAVASRSGADLIVMGARPRGRIRDRLFGDETRHLVANAEVPLLLRG